MKKLLSMFLVSGIGLSSSINVISCDDKKPAVRKHQIDLSNKKINSLNFIASADVYDRLSLKIDYDLVSKIYYQATNDKYGTELMSSNQGDIQSKINKIGLKILIKDSKSNDETDLIEYAKYGDYLNEDDINKPSSLSISFSNSASIPFGGDQADFIKSSLFINNFTISKSNKFNLKILNNHFQDDLKVYFYNLDVRTTNDDLYNLVYKYFIENYGLSGFGVTKETLLADDTFNLTINYEDNTTSKGYREMPLQDNDKNLMFPFEFQIVVSASENNKYFTKSYNYYYFDPAPNSKSKKLSNFKFLDNKIRLDVKNPKGIDLKNTIINLILKFLDTNKNLPCINSYILKAHLGIKILDLKSKVISDYTILKPNTTYSIYIHTHNIDFDNFKYAILDGKDFQNPEIIFS